MITAVTHPSTRPPTQASKNPDAIELDPETREYAPKDSAERQKRIKENRYFKYSNKNYLSSNYLVLILYASLAKINSTKINSRLFSLKEVSLNELF